MSFIKNTTLVLISNVSTIISGILVGFLLPMILTVDDYGLYKTFTLYGTYLGLFSLGIIDGIVLEYGNLDYEELERTRFRSYFKWYTIIQFAIALLILTISLLFTDRNIQIIIVCLSVNLIALNITGYYRQISEITQRFKEYSIVKFITSFLNIIIIITLFYMRFHISVKFDTYIYTIIATNLMISIWYIYRYWDISSGRSISLKVSIVDVARLSKKGIPLMVANLCSTLILTLDRQFVNVLFDNKEYAVYAFAYNLLSLLTVAISAISTVLYPTLKRSSNDQIQRNYENFIVVLSTLVFICISCYFPLSFIVNRVLSKYINALLIFRIILPGLPLTSVITVIIHNYYKTYGKSNLYFIRSIVVLVFSLLANVFAYIIFKSTAAISIASVISIVIWFRYADAYFFKLFQHNRNKIILYNILCMVEFYSITLISNIFLSFIIYLFTIFITTYVVWRNKVPYMLNLLKKTKK